MRQIHDDLWSGKLMYRISAFQPWKVCRRKRTQTFTLSNGRLIMLLVFPIPIRLHT